MHSVVDALPPPTSGHKSCFNIEKTMKLPSPLILLLFYSLIRFVFLLHINLCEDFETASNTRGEKCSASQLSDGRTGSVI